MDFVSTLLSLIGMGRDTARRVSDRRADVARLNAEAAAEAGRALDILTLARGRLLRRCAEVYPGNNEIQETCRKTVDGQVEVVNAMIAMTQELSEKIASAGWANWDLALQRANEMRATSSRFVPFVAGIIANLDKAIDDDERLLNGPKF